MYIYTQQPIYVWTAAYFKLFVHQCHKSDYSITADVTTVAMSERSGLGNTQSPLYTDSRGRCLTEWFQRGVNVEEEDLLRQA